MEKLTLDLPTMYGDHHVVEVRRLLLSLSGVEDVYASSAFHTAEISFDPAQVDAEQIKASLDKAGYLGDLIVPAETGLPATETNGSTFYRHTAAYATVDHEVSFTQSVAYSGKPLWPCPGMGPIQPKDEE